MTEDTIWCITIPSINSTQGEALSDFFEFEALSSSWKENKENPDVWDFQALFEDQPDVSDLKHRLKAMLDISRLSISELPQHDWLKESYRAFPALEIGSFYIYGSHIESPVPTHCLPIQVDAATAFGSGEHETTEGCLRAIEGLSQNRAFSHLLDMGCGSGILAMAMARLFQKSVLAVDNDPEAVRVTRSNAKRNNLEGIVIPLLSEGFEDQSLQEEGPYDLITANILAAPLCSMAPSLLQSLEEDGYVILSGLLNTQKEMVEAAYRMGNCELVEHIVIGDWSTLVMRKHLNE